MAVAMLKPRWGEYEDDGDLGVLLPPSLEIGPDENGIKKMIQFKLDEEGMLVKITTQTRIRKLANARLGRRAMERRSWSKFKNAVCEDLGSRLTVVSSEEILFERPRAPGTPISSYISILESGLVLVLPVLILRNLIWDLLKFRLF